MLIVVQCSRCHRTVNFWAADLVDVVGKDHVVLTAPFPCGRCRTTEDMHVSWRVPSALEIDAGLTVRRPVRKITKWIWRDERA